LVFISVEEVFKYTEKYAKKSVRSWGKNQQLVILTTEYDTPVVSKEPHSKQSMEIQKRTPESHSFTLE